MKLSLCIKLAVCFFCLTNIVHGAEQEPKAWTLNDYIELAENGSHEAQFLIGKSFVLNEKLLGEKFTDRERALKWLDEAIQKKPIYASLIGSRLT